MPPPPPPPTTTPHPPPSSPAAGLGSLALLQLLQSGQLPSSARRRTPPVVEEEKAEEAEEEAEEEEAEKEGAASDREANEGGECATAGDHLLHSYTAAVQGYWESIGASEPFWGVLTHDEYAGVAGDALSTDGETRFAASGKLDLEMMDTALRMHAGVQGGLASLGSGRKGSDGDGGRFLELGCGNGRVAAHMACCCSEIVCVDIAESYLAELRRRMADHGIKNYSTKTLAQLTADSGGCSDHAPIRFVYSLMTLQHNPPELMNSLVALLCSILSPGGFGVLHAPYELPPGQRVRGDAPVMQMHALSKEAMHDAVHRGGCILVALLEGDEYDRCGGGIQNALYVIRKQDVRVEEVS